MSDLDPNKPCGSCAFNRKGCGGAADEPYNRLRGIICAMGASPFWCHYGRDGATYKFTALGVLELPPGQRRVCAGWKRTVAAYARRGLFRSAWRRLLLRAHALNAYMALDEFVSEKNPVEKMAARVRIKRDIEAMKELERECDS